MLCIQKGAISPKFLHIATSDISKGQNWFFVFKKVQHRLCLCICVFKKVQYRLSLCILLHPIYQKDKTGFYVFKKVQHRLCLCICVFKTVQYRLRHLILLHLIYHKDKTGVVYSKRCKYCPMPLHIAASDISQGQIKLVLYIQKGAVSS